MLTLSAMIVVFMLGETINLGSLADGWLNFLKEKSHGNTCKSVKETSYLEMNKWNVINPISEKPKLW